VEYSKEDAGGKPRVMKGEEKLLDAAWHEQHLAELADYVIKLLDTADNVPDYLAANKSQFTPQNLLKKLD
jgi:hypothetical protein